jgi:hypothetical protein
VKAARNGFSSDRLPARPTWGGGLSGHRPSLLCVPDQRPVTEDDAARIQEALEGVRSAQDTLERAVARALRNGSSVRAVADLGLSPNTVQKYGRAHGWPTDDNRRRFYESRWDRDEREQVRRLQARGDLADLPRAQADEA